MNYRNFLHRLHATFDKILWPSAFADINFNLKGRHMTNFQYKSFKQKTSSSRTIVLLYDSAKEIQHAAATSIINHKIADQQSYLVDG